VIIFSDLHLRESTAETVLHEVLPGLLAAAKDRKIKEAACLGDVLHFRYRVDARILNALLDELQTWRMAGIKLHILPGNHDQYQIDGRNVLEVFNELSHVAVYSKPIVNEWGYWVPYRKGLEAVAQALRFEPNTRVPRVLFTHLPIQGAMMNDHAVNTTGIPCEQLAQWDVVFSGHYHKRQAIRRGVWYVGSPYQTRADESGQEKGYAIWDAKEKRTWWVNAKWGPRYHRITVPAGEPIDVRGIDHRDEVRVRVTGCGSEQHAERVYEQLSFAGIGGPITVTPEIEHAEARLAVADGAGMSEYVRAYVANHGQGRPPDELFRVFSEITGVQL
jgi:DNA repair exonuclease SbcCD nuclease subunit